MNRTSLSFLIDKTSSNEQNTRGCENAAGGRRIYERPDQPKNEKHDFEHSKICLGISSYERCWYDTNLSNDIITINKSHDTFKMHFQLQNMFR